MATSMARQKMLEESFGEEGKSAPFPWFMRAISAKRRREVRKAESRPPKIWETETLLLLG